MNAKALLESVDVFMEAAKKLRAIADREEDHPTKSFMVQMTGELLQMAQSITVLPFEEEHPK